MKGSAFGRLTLMTVLLYGTTALFADEIRTITLHGRKTATVTTESIRLSDIADITSHSTADDEAVIGLQKIYVGSSPSPGQSVTFSASQILDRMKEAGVNLDQVGYSLPRTISVERASRILTIEEVKNAVESALKEMKREVSLKDVHYAEKIEIVPGNVSIGATPLFSKAPGQMSFQVEVRSEDADAVKFEVLAAIDEWREIPIAKRPLGKGTIINSEDVVMARMNAAAIPLDAAHEYKDVLGHETNRDIGFGEVFRRNKLAVPPAAVAGSKVTLLYRQGLLEASATGIALESGILGQDIKVKNENSKKVVIGTIRESGIVEVRP